MAPWRAPTRPPRSAAARSNSEQDWRRALGRKVSLRYRLHDDPEHGVSEAVGFVQSVDHDDVVRVSIVNRRGEVTRVPLDDIEAAKLFPL